MMTDTVGVEVKKMHEMMITNKKKLIICIYLLLSSCSTEEKGKLPTYGNTEIKSSYEYITGLINQTNIFVEYYYPTSRNRSTPMRVIVNDSILLNARVIDNNLVLYNVDRKRLQLLAKKLDFLNIEDSIKNKIIQGYKNGLVAIEKTDREIIFQSYFQDSAYQQLKFKSNKYKDKFFNAEKKEKYSYGIRYIYPISPNSIDIYKDVSTINYIGSNLYVTRRQVSIEKHKTNIIYSNNQKVKLR